MNVAAQVTDSFSCRRLRLCRKASLWMPVDSVPDPDPDPDPAFGEFMGGGCSRTGKQRHEFQELSQVGQILRRWGDRRDSNPQHPEPQSGALPLSYGHHTAERKRYLPRFGASSLHRFLDFGRAVVPPLQGFGNSVTETWGCALRAPPQAITLRAFSPAEARSGASHIPILRPFSRHPTFAGQGSCVRAASQSFQTGS